MLQYCLLLLIISHHQVTPIFFIPSFSDIKSIIGYAYDVYGKLNEAYDLYGTYTADISLDNILEEVKDISNKINKMGDTLEQKISDAVHILIQRLPLIGKVDASMYDLHNYIVRVDGLYEDFLFYSEKKENFNNYTIQRFINTVTSHHANDLQDILGKIHRLIVPGRTSDIRRSLFFLLNKQTKASEPELCDTNESPQQRLFQLYATIMLTEMRGHLMTSFSYLLLELYEKVNFKGELEKAKEQLIKRATDLMNAVKEAMKYAPRDLRRCDPPTHIRNETFLEFFGFMQGYIANEQKMNPDDSCSATCETVKDPKQYDCHRSQPYFCPFNKCKGRLMNCTTGGDDKWDICEYFRDKPRRYGWFQDGSGTIYGEKDRCVGGYPIHPVGFRQGAYWCHYCMCICVADNYTSPARRIISLRPQVSDIGKNMVVTGLRFVDRDDMIHVQIRQGELVPEGRIKEDSEHWKKLERFALNEGQTSRAKTEVILQDRFADLEEPIPGSQYDRMAYGKDYTVLQYSQRQINLDDVMAPEYHVVTGVRLRHPKVPLRSESQPIELAIQITKFDFINGKLLPESDDAKWIAAENMTDPPKEYETKRTEFTMYDRLGNPLKSLFNLLDSSPNTYIKFRSSGWKEDAAQSTIPFLDAQPVHGEPGYPLGGVGLFHRGYKTLGGFIGFRIFSLYLPQYLNENLTDVEVATENSAVNENNVA